MCAFAARMEKVRRVYERLLEAYGPQHWWPAETDLEVVFGALLMQQTAWANVEQALANLRVGGLMDVHAIATASVQRIRRHVRVAGLYRSKPGRLQAFCRHLVDRTDGDLRRFFRAPTETVRADLLAQPGVGPETADSLLLYAGRHPVFVVDAYTVRIGARLGLFRTQEYDEVQVYFEDRLPRDVALFQEYHALLVRHAKSVCRPRPKCAICPLRTMCAYGRGQRS